MKTIVSVVALLSLAALPARAEDSAEAKIRSLVRQIGYGAGIHNFKNYVLRANEDYRTNADKFLGKAEETLAALKKDASLKDADKKAVEDIEKTVKQYHANLETAKKMIADGKSITDIDTAVKVDDTAAKAALEMLQKDRKWTALDRLDAALGYVGAIHHFKNYVLRGKEDYKTWAAAKFKDAHAAIDELRKDATMGDKEKKALDDIEGVVKKYEGNVDVVTKMMADKKSVKEIDTAVKVDDAPATAGLAVLRKE